MNNNLDKYFQKDKTGYYKDKKSNKYRLRGVSCSSDQTRNDKAKEQVQLAPVPVSKVYAYINEFLELIREDNGFTEQKIKVDTIKLDDSNQVHTIIDNGIIIRDNHWGAPHWDNNKFTYDRYDEKYDVIKETFDLERESDILWFKFTVEGHLAVVAGSCDINWDYSSSSGILVHEVGEEFDESFVFVFPLTKEMTRTKAKPNSYYREYSVAELELAVGNYLIEKGVPIIDYYSHMGVSYPEDN